MTNVSSMHEAGHSKLVHWDNLVGWDGEGHGMAVQDGGTHVHSWLIHVNVWQKPLQYCKVISLHTFIQVSQEAGQVVWYSHLFQNFPVCGDPHSQRLWHSQ